MQVLRLEWAIRRTTGKSPASTCFERDIGSSRLLAAGNVVRRYAALSRGAELERCEPGRSRLWLGR